ncbi:MAG TPA: two-component regulator propeller domain-containing protein [Terracidiphilus sp.]|nr:two-component regulator propeller domain-containing protein [Terracidiphilus sp.]
MRSFSTFREPMLRGLSIVIWMLAIVACICLAERAGALDSQRQVSQYVYDKWGVANGFIYGEIFAISQSNDGYLWIGTDQGLVRFDGTTFMLLDRPVSTEPSLGAVLGLAQDADGTLWIRSNGPELLRYRDGHFEDVFAADVQDEFTATSMMSSPEQDMLLWARGKRGYNYRKGNLTPICEPSESPGTVISMAETRDGSVWVGTSEGGLFRMKSSHSFSGIPELAAIKINAIEPAVTGGLWIGTDQGIYFWDGQHVTRRGLPEQLAHLQILALASDLTGNLWVGSDRGLLRISPTGVVSEDLLSTSARKEVNAIFIDREGELWYGGEGGLERLRDGLFKSWWSAQGLPAEIDGPIYAAADGRTWFAPRAGGLYWLRDGHVKRVTAGGLDHDVVYSLSGSGDSIWVGRQSGGLTRLTLNGNDVSARSYTTAEGLAQNSVYSLLCARDGSVWAGTVSGGVSRLKDGRITSYTTSSGLPADAINSLAEAYDGAIWAATPNGLASFSKGQWVRSAATDNLPSTDVTSIFVDSHNVLWIATARGLAFLNGSRLDVLRTAPEPFRNQILGMADDRLGHIWFVTSGQIMRVSRDQLLSGSVAESDIRSYGSEDGLRWVDGVNRDRSIMVDADGRLWLALTHGIAVGHPQLTASTSEPLDVRVESIAAGGHSWMPEHRPNTIPAGTHSVSFSFAAMTFVSSEHVIFRYKLDGSDPDWSAPSEARQVTFSNLGPGSYRFRVVASKGEGLWNGAETSIPFTIERAFWETWWFRTLCFATILLLVFALYRARMYQMARQLNTKFQERLAERTRIAQELHDTLLQGFLSASMQVDMAEDEVPENSPAKPRLRRALQLMREVTDEGRNALRGLRAPERDACSLEVALSRVGEELMIDDKTEYRVVTHSTTRVLRPSIREAVYRIGREAIANTFKHANAQHVEVQVEYAGGRFRLLVRDDGRGIDPDVLQAGREGHWGLPGMRERAESIGGTLKLRSRTGAGTEVELTVPGPIAFDSSNRDGVYRWRRWMSFGRKEKTMQTNGSRRPQ